MPKALPLEFSPSPCSTMLVAVGFSPEVVKTSESVESDALQF
jgi:hypothetical protein